MVIVMGGIGIDKHTLSTTELLDGSYRVECSDLPKILNCLKSLTVSDMLQHWERQMMMIKPLGQCVLLPQVLC